MIWWVVSEIGGVVGYISSLDTGQSGSFLI